MQGNAHSTDEFTLYGPRTDVTLQGNPTYIGAVAGKTLTVAGSALLLADSRSLGSDIKTALTFTRERYVECTGGRASVVVVSCRVDVVLVNCAPVEDITAALSALAKARSSPIGAYAHIGRYDPPSWKFGFYPRFSGTDAVPPAKYLEAAREWKDLGASVIGGCCGTTPEHIRELRRGL